jgi:hypothetical protein
LEKYWLAIMYAIRRALVLFAAIVEIPWDRRIRSLLTFAAARSICHALESVKPANDTRKEMPATFSNTPEDTMW